MFCSVCCSWCLYFPLPCLQLLVVLTVFTSTSKACNPGEATEKTTGSQSRSCSSDHRGECEVFGQYYGWARWADWAPRGNTESGVWCASWSVAARHWHTHTSPTTAWLYLDSGFFRDIYLQGKKKCGRVELVIEKGSSPAHVTAQECLSGLSNEPLAVGRCPFHLRREFVITDVCCLNQHTVCFLHQLMQRSSKWLRMC